MITMTKNDLNDLMEAEGSWSVSIYMPAWKAGRQIRQNPILFKNLLKKAEKQLEDTEITDKERKKILNPAEDLLNDSHFWQYQRDGLAVFSSPDFFSFYRLPEKFDELVVVAKRFHIKPLLPIFTTGGHFFVLALSQNEIRLFRATRYSLNVVNLDKVPQSLSQALKYDEPDTQLQYHSKTYHGTGERSAVFHGHGAGLDDRKQDLLHYFQKIDKGLCEILAEENAPLILASVDYYWPIFKEASSYSYLTEEGIRGNPEEIDNEELHTKAWNIVQPIFEERQKEALESYERFEEQKQTSTDIKSVVPAAHQGRVAVLFLVPGIYNWGVYKPEIEKVLLHKKAGPDNQDLLDLAAVRTFLNRGTVFTVSPEKMPYQSPVAAIFRY
ncbi:MAG: hypothetical protein ACOC5R_03895 [Elusimicrobiota bacterium]